MRRKEDKEEEEEEKEKEEEEEDEEEPKYYLIPLSAFDGIVKKHIKKKQNKLLPNTGSVGALLSWIF